MSLKVRSAATTDLVSSSESFPYLKALLDGTLSMANFINVMSLEGRVFSVQGGSITTPITFCGTNAVTTNEADLKVVAPEGTTIIPLEVAFCVETYGTTLLFEFMASIGIGSTTAITTATSVTPINVNLGSGIASNCTCGVAADSAGVVYPATKSFEFWRGSETKAVSIATADDDSTWQQTNFIWRASEAGYLPICKGLGSLDLFVSTEAGTGFVSAKYLEIPSEWLS